MEDLSLDPAQKAAAEAPDGPVLVLAGAGTGKTRTLVARVAHLVGRGVPPEAITVVTFTNKASREIAERVARFMPGERRPVVATFHSLANRILRAHASEIGFTPRFMIADEDDKEAVVRDVLKGFDPSRDVSEFVRKLDGWKGSGLTRRVVLDEGRERRSAVDERDAVIFLEVEAEFRRRDMMDFGDLVNECNDLLALNPEIGREISSGILHLLVDEAQDANPAQVTFARLLSSRHRNLFVVGDEDQSIYSFQGGRPSSLKTMVGPGASRHGLVRNRRSTDQILRPAVRLVSCNRSSRDKVLSSGTSGAEPEVRDFPNEKVEATYVATRVRELLKGGAAPRDVAVLVRSAFAAQAIEEAFVRMGVTYEVAGGLNLSRREEVRDVVAYLRLAIRPDDDLAFRRISARPARGIGPSVEEAVVQLARRSNCSIAQAAARLDKVEGVPVPEKTRESLEALSRTLGWLDAGFSSQGWGAREIVEFVLSRDGVGYEDYATRGDDRKARRRKDVLDLLRGLALACEEPVELLDRIAFSEEDFVPKAGDVVRIATMHSSKGLEWKHVFVPAFENGIVPSTRSVRDVDPGKPDDVWAGLPVGGVEEERRLAHVAFTRARTTLTVTWSKSRRGRPANESSFLHEAALAPMVEDPFAIDAFDPFSAKDAGFANPKAVRTPVVARPSRGTSLPVRRSRS